MTASTRVITLAAGAQQLPAPSGFALVARVFVEPLRSNAHASFFGISTVTADGSGTGVIAELAQPGAAATALLNNYEISDYANANTIDPTQFWVHGTTGEKIKASYYQR